jgi:quercetin dioxygenase-like cupin family protein
LGGAFSGGQEKSMKHTGSAYPTPSGHALNVGGHTVREVITSEDSGGSYYVLDQISPPGFGVPPHSHTLEDEIVFVIAGEFDIFLNGTVHKVGPGAVVDFPRGSLHGFKCTGSEAGHTKWVVMAGGNFQTFFRELATFPPGPPDFVRLDALHRRHGISMAPPADPWW